jgi:crotonobetainyl-CoA:carnitine CoA-transferase CaiB-like acyl-CoA transferase
MLLAELGANVIRIDRRGASGLGVPKPPRYDLLLRGRKAFALDLKREQGIEAALRLVDRADALIEGFRPGVMERLGLGPETLLARNPRLVYGRMTGWGQEGPLAQTAGHDLNYIAVGGALHSIGRPGAPPSLPLNLVGDYAGAVYLAFGIVAAILSARETGVGQVVDAAICDTSAHLMTSFYGQAAAGVFSAERGTNVLDGGAPYYDVYECKDGRYVSVAAIEPKFFAELLRRLGLDPSAFPEQDDRSRWREAHNILASTFKTRSRDEWSELLQGSDACFAPVLALEEAPSHPHFKARSTFVEIDGIIQPRPAPRFGGAPPDHPSPPSSDRVQSPEEALKGWLDDDEVASLRERGAFD